MRTPFCCDRHTKTNPLALVAFHALPPPCSTKKKKEQQQTTTTKNKQQTTTTTKYHRYMDMTSSSTLRIRIGNEGWIHTIQNRHLLAVRSEYFDSLEGWQVSSSSSYSSPSSSSSSSALLLLSHPPPPPPNHDHDHHCDKDENNDNDNNNHVLELDPPIPEDDIPSSVIVSFLQALEANKEEEFDRQGYQQTLSSILLSSSSTTSTSTSSPKGFRKLAIFRKQNNNKNVNGSIHYYFYRLWHYFGLHDVVLDEYLQLLSVKERLELLEACVVVVSSSSSDSGGGRHGRQKDGIDEPTNTTTTTTTTTMTKQTIDQDDVMMMSEDEDDDNKSNNNAHTTAATEVTEIMSTTLSDPLQEEQEQDWNHGNQSDRNLISSSSSTSSNNNNNDSNHNPINHHHRRLDIVLLVDRLMTCPYFFADTTPLAVPLDRKFCISLTTATVLLRARVGVVGVEKTTTSSSSSQTTTTTTRRDWSPAHWAGWALHSSIKSVAGGHEPEWMERLSPQSFALLTLQKFAPLHLQYHHHNKDDPLLLLPQQQQPQPNKDNTITEQEQPQPQSNSNQNEQEQQQQDVTAVGKECIPWSSSSSPWTPEIVALIFDNLPCTLPRGMTTPPNGVEELIGLALRHNIPIPSIFKNSQQWELDLSKIAMILYQFHRMEDALTYSNPHVIVETIATTLWSSSSKQLSSLLSPAQQCAKALLENDGGMAHLLYIMDKEFCQAVLNNNNEEKKQKNCTKATTTAWLAQIPVFVQARHVLAQEQRRQEQQEQQQEPTTQQQQEQQQPIYVSLFRCLFLHVMFDPNIPPEWLGTLLCLMTTTTTTKHDDNEEDKNPKKNTTLILSIEKRVIEQAILYLEHGIDCPIFVQLPWKKYMTIELVVRVTLALQRFMEEQETPSTTMTTTTTTATTSSTTTTMRKATTMNSNNNNLESQQQSTMSSSSTLAQTQQEQEPDIVVFQQRPSSSLSGLWNCLDLSLLPNRYLSIVPTTILAQHAVLQTREISHVTIHHLLDKIQQLEIHCLQLDKQYKQQNKQLQQQNKQLQQQNKQLQQLQQLLPSKKMETIR